MVRSLENVVQKNEPIKKIPQFQFKTFYVEASSRFRVPRFGHGVLNHKKRFIFMLGVN